MSQDGFKISVQPIIEKFIKRRQTKFANTHNCKVEDVHVHNQIPIWFLVKKFKEQYGIKSRVFKSLTPEQQGNWVAFYDQHKDLKIMTNEEHTAFHTSHSFNVKNESWSDGSTGGTGHHVHHVTTAAGATSAPSAVTPVNETAPPPSTPPQHETSVTPSSPPPVPPVKRSGPARVKHTPKN